LTFDSDGRTMEEEPARKVANMARLRRVMVVVGLVLLATAATAGAGVPAGSKHVVGPKQYFTGVLNGKAGNTTVPIVIKMACFGAVRPGQTGHPMSGQTVAIVQLFPPATTAGSLGYTGKDSEIGAFFIAPPPAAARARDSAGTPVFTHYGSPQPLPTSLVLPCYGTRTVWFTPIPVVPPSRSASIPVRFVGQP